MIIPTRRIGQRLKRETILECRIYAHPQLITLWKRNDKPISTSGRFTVEAYTDIENRLVTLSLRINHLAAEDYGRYVCEGSNSLGTDEEEMILYGEEQGVGSRIYMCVCVCVCIYVCICVCEDYGRYVCEGSNSLGTDEEEMILYGEEQGVGSRIYIYICVCVCVYVYMYVYVYVRTTAGTCVRAATRWEQTRRR